MPPEDQMQALTSRAHNFVNTLILTLDIIYNKFFVNTDKARRTSHFKQLGKHLVITIDNNYHYSLFAKNCDCQCSNTDYALINYLLTYVLANRGFEFPTLVYRKHSK